MSLFAATATTCVSIPSAISRMADGIVSASESCVPNHLG